MIKPIAIKGWWSRKHNGYRECIRICSYFWILVTDCYSSMGRTTTTYTGRIRHLSDLFPLSSIFGLMPCAEDDTLNRRLSAYAVIVHTAYRILNIAVLTYFLMKTRTSISLKALLAVDTVMKLLCVTVHVVVVLKNRHCFLTLIESCIESDFARSKHRKFSKLAMMFCLYLYLVAQVTQKRWEAAIRDIFSMFDVLVPILITMQFCTFLEIATEKFKTSKFRLVVYFYRTDDMIDKILGQHLQDLEMVSVLHDLYTQQMLFSVCFFGFDFFVSSYDLFVRVGSGKDFIQIICPISYCTFLLSTIMILARACEACKKKAEKFDQELFLLMNENQVLRRNPKLQLYLKRKTTINFTGGHFFNIGYSLVTSIVAATATYLLFLIQFRDDDD